MVKSINLLLLFLLTFSNINAQESQDIAAAKWKDGKYEKFNVTKGMQSKFYDEKVEIGTKNGKVQYVKLMNMYKYVPGTATGTDFVIS